MAYNLPELPYAMDALDPYMSAETFEYHHGKHHKAYIDKANELIPGTGLEDLSVEDALVAASKNPEQQGLFNQIAQHYNHSFFWESMAPNGGGTAMPGALEDKIKADLGGYDDFRGKMIEAGMTQFGSGWAWLVLDQAIGKLEITKTANAGCPLTDGKTPLLTCDVWEHAYYIDYRNARPKFLEAFIDNLINWEEVAKRLEQAG